MTKLHWCCGDVYLKDYTNIDIEGYVFEYKNKTLAFYVKPDPHNRNWPYTKSPDNYLQFNNEVNPNETTLDNYFKYPFIQDPVKRAKNKRPFIIDKVANILEPWEYSNNSVDEIVMISCIEHFDPKHELPHILSEINRVMKVGGKLIIDFPDIKRQVEIYMDKDPEFCYELIYCNHKNKYAIHHWGFNEITFPKWLGHNWNYEFFKTENFIVKHDYPMIGCFAVKK